VQRLEYALKRDRRADVVSSRLDDPLAMTLMARRPPPGFDDESRGSWRYWWSATASPGGAGWPIIDPDMSPSPSIAAGRPRAVRPSVPR
jgi:hypothetical protein